LADRPFVDRPVGDVERASHAAVAAAVELGLPAPTLRRLGMNGVFDAGPVVLRVSSPTVDAVLGLHLAETLRSVGIPVAAPADARVVRLGELSVTAWERVEPSGRPIDWRTVGASLRQLHEVPFDRLPAGFPVPSPTTFPWWDFEDLFDDLGDEIDPAARDGLVACVHRHAAWRELVRSDAVVCHGDVHPGNVVMADDGPVLLDWDLVCRAHPAWDHAPMLTWAARWGGRPGEYDDLAGGAGVDLRDDRAAVAFAELRLVAATLMRVRAGRTDVAAATEAERRLRFWRGDPDAPAWHAQ
jgi:aminoglycoside phosphotransferase (APT) family kinase protein